MRQAKRGWQMVAGLVLVAWCAAASAFTIGLKPDAGSHAQGATFTLDVVATGFGSSNEVISAYDIDFVFDAAKLQFDCASSAGKLGSTVISGAFGPPCDSTGAFFLYEASFEDDVVLAGLQTTDPFTLATLTFTGLDLGTSFVELTLNAIGGSTDQSGVPVDLFGRTTVSGASVTIIERTTNVPEPATLALLALGLLLLTQRLRRASRNS
jgi:hypothetical protein